MILLLIQIHLQLLQQLLLFLQRPLDLALFNWLCFSQHLVTHLLRFYCLKLTSYLFTLFFFQSIFSQLYLLLIVLLFYLHLLLHKSFFVFDLGVQHWADLPLFPQVIFTLFGFGFICKDLPVLLDFTPLVSTNIWGQVINIFGMTVIWPPRNRLTVDYFWVRSSLVPKHRGNRHISGLRIVLNLVERTSTDSLVSSFCLDSIAGKAIRISHFLSESSQRRVRLLLAFVQISACSYIHFGNLALAVFLKSLAKLLIIRSGLDVW